MTRAAPVAAVTFPAMGTMVSFRAANPDLHALVPDLAGIFAAAEERFSRFRAGSELSRIRSGTLALSAASKEMQQMQNAALGWQERTSGTFTPYGPDGALDLDGIVKASAIAGAARLLDARGASDWCLNAGGDLESRGLQPDANPWAVGIADPLDRTRLLTRVNTGPDRCAVATSGTAERGDHVWRTGGERGAGPAEPPLVQVTVCAAEIITADVLATAILAGGTRALEAMLSRFDVDVLAVDAAGRLRGTPFFRAPNTTAGTGDPGRPDQLPSGTGSASWAWSAADR